MAEMLENPGPPAVPALPWQRLRRRAARALLRVLAACGEASPGQAARVVAGVLPARWRAWLLDPLAARGWLSADARISCDVLEGPDCPAEFRGPCRALVRLAVFGPPGQGLAWRDRHRQDVYQQFCAEIMREAVDLVSLEHVAHRVLGHGEVTADGQLGALLRAFIAQRQAALRTIVTPEERQRGVDEESKLRRGWDEATPEFPTRERLLDMFGRLQREFEAALAQFEEPRARKLLDRMRDLRQRFPVHIDVLELQRAEEQHDRLLRRVGTYRRQIQELTTRGAQAALSGDERTAAWVSRRLEAIHTLLPSLLPPAELERLRNEIARGEDQRESAEAVAELRAREQNIAQKIKELAGVIHRFHELAGRLPPEHNAYRRAELNYRRAVEEIRAMDTEWLTGLVLQLETLLEDLEDPQGTFQTQLDRFIAAVRTALNRLCLEIRMHQRNRAVAPPRPGPPPPSAGDAPAPPN